MSGNPRSLEDMLLESDGSDISGIGSLDDQAPVQLTDAAHDGSNPATGTILLSGGDVIDINNASFSEDDQSVRVGGASPSNVSLEEKESSEVIVGASASSAGCGRSGVLLDYLSRKRKASCVSRRGSGRSRKLSLLAAAARGRSVLLHEFFSSEGQFSDDETVKDQVCESDGNNIDSDGDLCSVIGSICGKDDGTHDPDYRPDSDSVDSDEIDVSFEDEEFAEGVPVVVCDPSQISPPTIERPIGMMLAKEKSDNPSGNFVCSKVRQVYDKHGCDPSERFEVVFRDGSTSEYCRDEVLRYRSIYLEHEGCRGCDEFHFRV